MSTNSAEPNYKVLLHKNTQKVNLYRVSEFVNMLTILILEVNHLQQIDIAN